MNTESSKEKEVIKTEGFEIGDNIFKYNRAVIQVSNIAYFNVAPIPAIEYPKWAFVGIIIGCSAIFLQVPIIAVIGLTIAVFCGYEICSIFASNQKFGEYLTLALNSGEILYFTCYNNQFLYEVENIIMQCFKDKSLRYKVDLKDCIISYQEDNMTINNTGNIVTGNSGTITASNTGSINEGSAVSGEDWEKLESAFKEIVSKVDVNTYEHMLAVSAQYQICKKNRAGLKEIIEENLNEFRNNIFSTIALTGITGIIKRITGLDI